MRAAPLPRFGSRGRCRRCGWCPRCRRACAPDSCCRACRLPGLPCTPTSASSLLPRCPSPLASLPRPPQDVTQAWNDAWVEAGEADDRYFHALLAVTVAAYAGCAAIGGLLFHWFAPAGADCSLNISLIVLSLVLCLVLSLVTVHPRVSAGGAGGGDARMLLSARSGALHRARGACKPACTARRWPRHHAACMHPARACAPPPRPRHPAPAGGARLALPRRRHLALHHVPGLLGPTVGAARLRVQRAGRAHERGQRHHACRGRAAHAGVGRLLGVPRGVQHAHLQVRGPGWAGLGVRSGGAWAGWVWERRCRSAAAAGGQVVLGRRRRRQPRALCPAFKRRPHHVPTHLPAHPPFPPSHSAPIAHPAAAPAAWTSRWWRGTRRPRRRRARLPAWTAWPQAAWPWTAAAARQRRLWMSRSATTTRR